MRKLLLSLTLATLAALQALAVPADPRPVTVTQPDGSQLTIKNNGDEYYNFVTTADGYTIVKNQAGYFTYAQLVDGKLAASSTIARDAQQRTATENAMLQTTGKCLTDRASVSTARKARASRNEVMQKASIDYKKFRGLILLVEFNDCKFRRSDLSTFYNNMINQRNYTGFTNEDGTPNAYGKFTGSVRDYFYDNSLGQFDPQFDVYGPISVPYSVDDPKQTQNARTIIKAALQKAYQNYNIDFSLYDANGDRMVDMFYVIFAGTGSNTNASSSHVWPHASSMTGTSLGGYAMGRYACSTELYYESPLIFDGIGTICHEFTHVLGLPDLYDTDYSTNGQSHDPGEWDVMSGGSYLNYGRTPCAYSAYDRYAAGFMTPKVVTQGDFTLNGIQQNEAFRLNTNKAKEFFLIENRQQTGWDAYLPGHGMVVARVDSTNAVYWVSNMVNAYSSRNCYELLRAGNSKTGALASDPFPGTTGMTTITNNTNPGFFTPLGNSGEYVLNDIAESNGVITFSALKADDVKSIVEDFESMPVGASTSEKNVKGNFCNWSFTRCQVTAPGSGKCNGTHSLAMTLPGKLETTTRTGKNVTKVTFNVYNPSSTTAKFVFDYSTDFGKTWTPVKTSAGADMAEVAGKSEGTTVSWNIKVDNANALLRVTQRAGSQTAKVYIDDFTIYYSNEFSGVNSIEANGSTGLKVTKSGNTAIVTGAADGAVNLYTAGGQLVQSVNAVDGQAQLSVSGHGFYIVSQGGKAVKVVF